MPIGKDSIQKRIAKTTSENTEAPENSTATVTATVQETVALALEKNPPRKRTTSSTPGAKKPAAKNSGASKTDAASVETTVMGNVSPEVVEKVTGHEEGGAIEHVSIGDKMPNYLL